MKYIIFDNSFPVIFQEGIGHNEIKVKGMSPTSAGFISVIPKVKEKTPNTVGGYFDIRVFGESISLGLKPRDNDLQIFERYFNNYY